MVHFISPGLLFPHQMTKLILASTNRYFGFGDKDDHVVLDGGRCIGRIFQAPQAPLGCPWFWTITAMDYPRSIHSRGYSVTREQAMVDFKAQWLAPQEKGCRMIERQPKNQCRPLARGWGKVRQWPSK